MKKKVEKKFRAPYDRAGISGGILFGSLFIIFTLIGKFFDLFGGLLNILLGIYGNAGYDITYFGILLGGVYGFITGFILFYLYSWIYENLEKK